MSTKKRTKPSKPFLTDYEAEMVQRATNILRIAGDSSLEMMALIRRVRRGAALAEVVQASMLVLIVLLICKVSGL